MPAMQEGRRSWSGCLFYSKHQRFSKDSSSKEATKFLSSKNTYFVASNSTNHNATSIVERKIRSIKELYNLNGWDDWHTKLNKIVSLTNLTTSPSLGNLSPANVHFSRTFDIPKTLHISPMGENLICKNLRINYWNFRQFRMKRKTKSVLKQHVRINRKCRIRENNHWSTDLYKIVRITPDSVGVVKLGENPREEKTRRFDDITLDI